jgi:predicted permease
MEQAAQIINRVLPILLLIFIGNQMRLRRFISESTVEELRKIIINLALPSVLFLTFSQIELKFNYLFVFILLFTIDVFLFGLGNWIQRRFRVERQYFRFLMTGFEYGMLGVSLFGGAYGLQSIGYLAIVDLGHEIFTWFILLAFLMVQRDGLQDPRQLVGTFFKSPVILGILLGLVFNLLGLKEVLFTYPFTGGLMATMQLLANLTIPVMLLIVGYGIQIDRSAIREIFPVILIRLALLVPLALLLGVLVIRQLLGLERALEAALFTLLILPPPFIFPLYIRADQVEERRYVNNVLALYTIISISIFIVYFIFHPTL